MTISYLKKSTLHGFLLLTCLFLSFGSKAQVINLSNDPSSFLEDFEKVFKNAKNETAIAEFDRFRPHFETDFSVQAKTSFVKLSQTLAKRGYQMPEYYRLILLFNNSYGSESLAQNTREKLIEYLDKLAATQTKQKTTEILIQLGSFLSERKLYADKFNTLYALSGSFDFSYHDTEFDYINKSESEAEKKNAPQEDFGLFDDWDKASSGDDPWDNPNLTIKPGEHLRLIDIPRIKGLLLELKNVDLVMVSPSDSFLIRQTSGAADLLSGKFVGNKGEVNWDLVGVPEAKASLSEYTFDIRTPYIKAEKVEFSYENKLSEKVSGVFEFKGTNRKKDESTSYPRFKSFDNDVKFKKLEDDIDYKGGFSLIGNRIFSSSLYHNTSTVYVNRGHSNSFKVEGPRIEFTDSLITSDLVSFTSYIKEDSIYHPAVKMRYDLLNKVINLNKVDKGGFRNSMYSNTFHEVDIKSDAMKWDLNSGKMDFYIVSGKTEVPAIFQSFNYYNPAHLRELSNLAGFNPLIFLGNYLFKKGENRFTLSEIESRIKKTPQQIKNGIIITNQMGFVDYEPNSDTYSLSRKGLHYFKSYIGKEDYDDLVFTSYSDEGKGNASIDRNSNTLDIAGTREFKLSDSLGIRFLSKDKNMKMEGSKSFKFNGEIIVKNYNFYGDFEVDYEKFLVNLLRIDSITFTPIDIYNKKGKADIGGEVLYAQTGILYLNAPDNKSGRKKLPQFPRLVIPEGALVKFDNPRIRDFTYPENVVFKIDPIDHDSLNLSDLAYGGKFSSGGIIQDLTETLVVMPDTTLGFVHKAKGDYALYGTNSKFKFDAPLQMTKKGLMSKGTLSHLAATISTEESLFGSEEMIMKGDTAHIAEKSLDKEVYFPDVKINEYQASWKPTADSLIIKSDETFSFYKASSLLAGQLVLRSAGLFGQGQLQRKDSEVDSKAIKFNKSGFLASESTFKIKTEEESKKPILDARRVQLDFSIDKNIVSISPEESNFNDTLSASLGFPYAAYKTTIDNAVWNILDKKISMKGNVENSTFTSTAASQFGLSFHGEAAEYDIAENTLNMSGVPGIKTVDALIVPQDGKVAVRSEKLLPFTEATVLVDTLNEYHRLANANITVNSKLSYSGDASYQFVNVSSDTFNIKMDSFEFAEISPDGQILNSKKSGKLSTIARAKVTEKDSVFLSPKMLYIGELSMLAPFKNLQLNGQVTPVLNKYPVLARNWINYSGSKSEEILINVDESLKDGGKPLFAGIHLNPSASSESLYPTFLSAKRREEDIDIFLARGVFRRDETNKRFIIRPEEDKSKTSASNSYDLYDEDGLIILDGRFNLLEPSIAGNMETVGNATLSLDSLTYIFNTFIKYNFPVPPPILAKMGDHIVKTNLDVGNTDPAIAFEDSIFLSKVAQFIGPKSAEDYKTQYYEGHIPLFKHSPKFYATAVFSDLQLKWNPVFNAFHSVGPIGISNIGETDINAKVPGYFEIIKNPNKGDEVSFFLEISPETWYYFAYKDEQLGIASSDFEFNKMLTEKDKSSSKGVELINADMAEAMKFRKRFLISYLGVSADVFEQQTRTPVAVPGKITPVQVPQVEGAPVPAAAKKKEENTQDGF